MIKTKYLGYNLEEIYLLEEDQWQANYFNDETLKYMIGRGHTPEAALAEAQKNIKELKNATEAG